MAKLMDNIVIYMYGIMVLNKKAILQISLKKDTSILLNIDIHVPCSPTLWYPDIMSAIILYVQAIEPCYITSGSV